MTARCETTDLEQPGCQHCRDVGKPRTPTRRRTTVSPTVEARYPGSCMSCGERYTAGAAIKYDAATDGWICEDCVDEGCEP